MDVSRCTEDKYKAVAAKFEAQKIAFSPLSFQAVQAMLELGVLKNISDSGEKGLTKEEIAEKCGISSYGAGLLADTGLVLKVLRLNPQDLSRFVLGKIGFFLLEDELTRVNFNFVRDVCYKGAFFLAASIKEGKPRGLSVFGDKWNTVYEALSELPQEVKKSWFEFDHFYSDLVFKHALPIVFEKKLNAGVVRHIFDLGGNTAKWAICCCKYNANAKVTVLDLPGQTELARKNAKAAGFEARIDTIDLDILSPDSEFPPCPDIVWMSQFLDCFSIRDITKIAAKIAKAASEKTRVYVLEPLIDMQRFEAAEFSLTASSLYFTCIANGKSRMYRYGELKSAVEAAGFELECAHHNLAANSYSLLKFRPAIRREDRPV
ncbi:O-methyltransferase [Spirochaetia bacterium]|nr:O-methyltransferase [Spirochaetia bacterium]